LSFASRLGYWLLAIGYWLLAIGYWLLAIREASACHQAIISKHLNIGACRLDRMGKR